MTKEEFYKQINKGRYPKYAFSQIKEGTPKKNCSSIVCTASDRLLLAKYQYGKWEQAHFSTTEYGCKQGIYYTDINEDIVYWIDGEAEDRSREQFYD